MIGWIIFIFILVLISAVLLSSVKITFNIGEKVLIKSSFLFLTLYKYDSTKDIKTPVKIKKEEKRDEDLKALVGAFREYAASKHTIDMVIEVFGYLKVILSKFKCLLAHTRFKRIVLDLSIATNDASVTAITYGRVCSVVYPLIKILDSTALKFEPKYLSIKTDFVNSQLKLYSSGVIKVKLVYILGFVVSTALSVIKLKIGDINYGKQ